MLKPLSVMLPTLCDHMRLRQSLKLLPRYSNYYRDLQSWINLPLVYLSFFLLYHMALYCFSIWQIDSLVEYAALAVLLELTLITFDQTV